MTNGLLERGVLKLVNGLAWQQAGHVLVLYME